MIAQQLTNFEHRQVATEPQIRPTDVGYITLLCCYCLRSPLPFINITHPEIWCSFYETADVADL